MTNLALPAALVVFAAFLSAGLITLLRPVLIRYALAQPNARSLHTMPTPQGGGIAVIASVVTIIAGVFVYWPNSLEHPYRVATVLAAAVSLAIVGATDDMRPVDVMPRLIFQAVAVAFVIAALPPDLRVAPALPWWIERTCLLLGGIWFVNLVNFMDGIDWMTVVEVVPVTIVLAIFGILGTLPFEASTVALTLCGAMIGFAPFNKPVARLFLGDVGSLPIGLLIGWLLVMLAGNGYFAAALLLPLYYLLDTGVTLIARLRRGEKITQAHRKHYYQRALENGFTVRQVIGKVLLLNVGLAVMALATTLTESHFVDAILLLAGISLVAFTLRHFVRKRTPRQRI